MYRRGSDVQVLGRYMSSYAQRLLESEPCRTPDGKSRAEPPAGADPRQGRRRLPADRPAGGVEVARRRRRARLRTVDDQKRAGPARGARAARASARLGRSHPDRRGPALCGRPHARLRPGPRAGAAAGAVADPPRGGGGDARDHGDALAGHEPAGGGLRAGDGHRDDQARRGAGAAAAGGDGRGHHLDRRRLEDARDVRQRRRPGPRGVGGGVPERAARRPGPGGADAQPAPGRSEPVGDRAGVPRAPGGRPSARSPPRARTRCISMAPRGCSPPGRSRTPSRSTS